MAPPYAGSTEVHPFPPATPTNAFPSLFPTGLGYAGYTATGAEPALVATAPAYPVHTGAPQLIASSSLEGAKGLSTGNAMTFSKNGVTSHLGTLSIASLLDWILARMHQRVVESLAYISCTDMVMLEVKNLMKARHWCCFL